MTVLSVIRDAAARIRIPQPSSIVGTTDRQELALLGAFIEEGKDLLTEDPGWSFLNKEFTFDTVAGVENYALPGDYERMINNTIWDRNQFWQVRGNLTPQQWQVIRSGLYQTARLSANFRIKQAASGIGQEFFLDPIPGSVRTLVFEYYSNAWTNNGVATFENPPADTTEVAFDEELLTRGVVWRYKQGADLPFAADLIKYNDFKDKLIAQDKPSPTLTVNEMPWRLPIGNIPDTGFGLT